MDRQESIPTETTSSDAPPSPYLPPKTNFLVELVMTFVPYLRKTDPGRKPLEAAAIRRDWDAAARNKCRALFAKWMLGGAYCEVTGVLIGWALHSAVGNAGYETAIPAGMVGAACCFAKMMRWMWRGGNTPTGVAYRQQLKDEAEARLQANDPERTF